MQLRTFFLFSLTGVAEIAGCYLTYLWLRRGQPAWLLGPSALSLDGVRPDRWDLIGAAVSVLGMAIILFGPRG